MNTRHEISADQWRLIEPLLPARKKRGRPRADDQQTLNGILYVLKTGCAWADLPDRYGAPVTCWRRLRDWTEDGTWERIWQTLLGTLDAQGRLEWQVGLMDGTFVAAKKGALGSALRTKDAAPIW